MKKIKSKILLSVGAIATLAMTSSVLLSCGTSKSDQQKLDGITNNMVKTVITKVLAPTTSKPVPPNPPTFIVSINGLDGVTITVSDWTPDSTQGSVSFSVASIFKETAHVDVSKFGTITISGFATDQDELNGITTDMVKTVITKVLAPTTSNPVPEAPKNNEFTNLSINGLDDVTITIANWVKDIDLGSVSFSIVQLIKGPAIEGGSKFGTITISGFSSDQSKLDGITADMIRDAIISKLPNPSPTTQVPDAPTLTGITIHGLSDVTITISSWTKDPAQGVVSFSITSIDKGTAHVDGAQFGNISISGYSSTDLDKLNKITIAMVNSAITAVLNPGSSILVPDAPADNKYTGISINGLDNVSITISNWAKDNWLGSVSFSIVSIDKGVVNIKGATFGTITITGFQSTYTFSPTGDIKAQVMMCTIQTKKGKYLVGTDQGLWASIDDGTTFTKVTKGVLPDWHIFSLYQTSNGNIYIGGDDGLSQGRQEGLWVSTDDGTTFTKVENGLPRITVVKSIYQTSNGDLYIGTTASQKGLWVLKNGGTTFTQVVGIQTELNIFSICQTSNGYIYVSVNSVEELEVNALLVSKDQGGTFTQVGGPTWQNHEIQTIYQTSDGNIYIGTDDNGLWVSPDGDNYNPVGGGMQSNWDIRTILQISNNDIFVGTSTNGGIPNGLWVSRNGGTSFTQASIADGSETWGIHSLYQAPNHDKLFIGTEFQGLWVNYKTK